MSETIERNKAEQDAFLTQMQGIPGMSGMLPVPSGPGGATSMPNQGRSQDQLPPMEGMDPMMQTVFQEMITRGLDPGAMTADEFAQFFQQMQAGGGGGGMQAQPPQGPAAQQGYGGGYGSGGNFRGGRGGRQRW